MPGSRLNSSVFEVSMSIIIALLLALSSPALAQQGCQYQGATGTGRGMEYLSTRLLVPQNGRCSHFASGTARGIEIVAPPSNGRIEASSGSITYIPREGFTGSDQYVFSGQHSGGRAQVTVNVEVR